MKNNGREIGNNRFKQQSACYRNINGIKYTNYSDLIQGDDEVARIISDAKEQYPHVKKIKHHSGEYYQLFVSK